MNTQDDNDSVNAVDVYTPSKHRPKGIPLIDILELREKNLSQSEIGKVLGMTQQTVSTRLKKYASTYRRLDSFKRHRADLLALKQADILDSMNASKIKDASLLQASTSMGILNDKERLERGQATVNVDIHLEVQQAGERIRALREMIEAAGGTRGEEEADGETVVGEGGESGDRERKRE